MKGNKLALDTYTPVEEREGVEKLFIQPCKLPKWDENRVVRKQSVQRDMSCCTFHIILIIYFH